jgi:3-hydroxymyristoyl/3-hydroxydecanoyl-(acyl carrier protein) dehydratase
MPAEYTEYAESLEFASDHPVFAGHFPGRPIVPGVLLLDAAQQAVEKTTGLVLSGIAAAKFISPSLPGETLTLEYRIDGSAVRFEIRCDVRKIANGRFLVTPDSAA